MAALSDCLTEYPTPSTQVAIIEGFWKKRVREERLTKYASFFSHYHWETRRFRLGVESDKKGQMAAKTHQEILSVVDTLSERRQCQRSDVRDALRSRFPGATTLAIDKSIDQAIRMWLMLNVLSHERAIHLTQTPAIQWDEHSNLVGFVENQFAKSQRAQNQVLDYDFTAVNIIRYSGVKIKWTSSLTDHLRLERKRDQRILRIYPFKQCLLDHLEAAQREDLGSQGVAGFLIPATVLKETLLSLDILFPHWDPRTDSFLCSEGQDFHYQSPFEDPQHLNLDDFNHWRDRLVELYSVYQAPAPSWTQLWTDRRNPLQWWTFWLALAILFFTLVFGIIGSVTGIMQVRIAQEGLALARSSQL